MFRSVFALYPVVLVTAPASTATPIPAKLALPASRRFITRDIVWNCGPDACQGATEESRLQWFFASRSPSRRPY